MLSLTAQKNLTYGQIVDFTEMCRQSVPFVFDANVWDSSIVNHVHKMFQAFRFCDSDDENNSTYTSDCCRECAIKVDSSSEIKSGK